MSDIIALNSTFSFKFPEGRAVITRKDHRCFTGRNITKGSAAFRIKILPNSRTGRLWDLEKPHTVYFCGRCGDCTSA